MLRLFSRLLAPFRRRAFKGVGGGRRWDGAGTIDNLDSSVVQGSATLCKRAVQFVNSNPWAAEARRSLIASVVGLGLKPQSKHPNQAERKALDEFWTRRVLVVDAKGRTDFCGIQEAIVGSLVTGEGFGQARLRASRWAGCALPAPL